MSVDAYEAPGPGDSLLQVDRGQAVDVAHLLQGDVQLRAQDGRGAGLLWGGEDHFRLLRHLVQALLNALQLRVDFL